MNKEKDLQELLAEKVKAEISVETVLTGQTMFWLNMPMSMYISKKS